ncbi:MAG: hypothetical protein E7399_07020 [Ruminococcaceae bacterium]|nr:hypothetical protein [Oscillospiraceae bacterium]
MTNYPLDRIKLIVSILKRDEGGKLVNLFRSHNLYYDYITLGQGTASSEVLDYLGLENNEKDVVISMAPLSKIPMLLTQANQKFQLEKPGHGIMFTIPLSSVSAQIPQVLCKPENMKEIEAITLDHKTQYKLILTVCNRDNYDIVMKAAKSAGARGGTLFHARRAGFEDGENFFGFTIQPEKDVVAILAERSQCKEIMEAITKAAGIETECHAIVLSVPVDEIMGI